MPRLRRPASADTAPPEIPRGVLVAAACLALGWTLLQVVAFLRLNPVLWMPMEGRQLGIFGFLFTDDWFVSARHCPPGGLALGLFVAALNLALGLQLLAALRLRLPWASALPIAFVLGVSVSGVVLELLGMAGLLRTPWVWAHWALLLGGAWLWARKRQGSDEILPMEGDPPSEEVPSRVLRPALLALTVLVLATTFWHALLYPETYWDSLILYLGYARMIFLEGAFPFKAVGQVGIGLGANYPHLYLTYGAAASALAGEWSDVPQRLAAPLAGAGAAALVHELVRLATGKRVAAAGAALLYASTPYVLAYHQYASDYAFVLLFTAAAILTAALFQRAPCWQTMLAHGLVVAGGMHINYLMGMLGVAGIAAAALVALRGAPELGLPRGLALLGRKWFWIVALVCLALGSPWFVRNAVLTGNPVYAFFHELFPATMNINPEVMESAEIEWFRNGDGVARLGEVYHDLRRGQPPVDQGGEDFHRRATVGDKLAASFAFWQGFDAFRVRDEGPPRASWLDRAEVLLRVGLPIPPPDNEFASLHGGEVRVLHWQQAYKLAPLALGFALPGLLVAVAAMILRAARGEEPLPAGAVLVPAVAVLAALLAFHYALGDFYLYQVIGIAIPMAALAGMYLGWVLDRGRAAKAVAGTLLLLVGVVSGLGFGMMGFKAPSAGPDLMAFRYPGLPAEDFYRLRFGDEVDVWQTVNGVAPGTALLTHENRHYLFDPSIELVHLDDWDVQQTWGLPLEERLAFLRERGVRYYLRIPNEANHRVNERAGVQELIDAGHLRLVQEAGGTSLWRLLEE